MASKLDYLKKYLAKPGKSSDVSVSLYSSAGDGKARVGKDKSVKRRAPDMAAMQIRDLSEALPRPRAEKNREAVGFRRGDMGTGGSLAAEADDELVFVDQHEVDEKSKLDVETSGIAWKISQHRMAKPPGRGHIPPRQISGAVGASAEAAGQEHSSPPRPSAKDVKPERPGEDDDSSPPGPPAQGVKREQADSDDDLSPPRPSAPKGRPASRANGADSDDDLSPPRHGGGGAVASAAGAAASSASRPSASKGRPAAGAKGADSDDDLSPPRHCGGGAVASAAGADASTASRPSATKGRPASRAKGADSDNDLSPPRHGGGGAVASAAGAAASTASRPSAAKGRPSAGAKGADSDDDLSPPRHGGGGGAVASAAGADASTASRPSADGSDDDLSPPRPGAAVETASAATASAAPNDRRRSGRHDSDSDDLSPPRCDAGSGAGGRKGAEEPERMSSGLRAGLVQGSVLKEQAAQVRADRRAAILAATDEQTGRNATTVYRNREGARIQREEWVEQQQKKRRKKLSDYPEQELEWGGGVKQQYSREAEMEETARIAAQPFARYEPDERYMEELKERQDWNDPMRKFQGEDDDGGGGPVAGDGGGGGAVAAGEGAGSARAAAAARQVNKPKCPHAPWPNRFNIPPGYRWDGKVRGNGYEKKWLQAKNHREHIDRERWKYEMEEM